MYLGSQSAELHLFAFDRERIECDKGESGECLDGAKKRLQRERELEVARGGRNAVPADFVSRHAFTLGQKYRS